MRRPIRASVAALVALVVLAACAAPAANIAPVPVPAAPTARPSATPRPTRTPKPTVPTATPDPAVALREAIDRTKWLSAYRLHFSIGSTASGDSVRVSAAVHGGDAEFTYGGRGFGNGAADYRAVKVGSQGYLHGPTPLPGMGEDRWYALDEGQASALAPPLDARKAIEMLTARLPLADLTPDGAETLHGQACARYRGGLAAALGALDGTGRPTTPEAQAAEATPVVERMRAQGYAFGPSEALVWVCADGFLHQMRVAVEAEQAGASFDMNAELELSEHNGDLAIAAPENAVPPGPALAATVFNGGNVRAAPSLQGAVLDQINAGELVTLLAKAPGGRWYQIMNIRGVTGWVSATLLTVAPAVAGQVPVK